MPDPQYSGQVVLPNDGQVTDVANPEPNQIAQQISAQRTTPATPIQTPVSAEVNPSAQVTPDTAGGGREHLMGRMVGKLMSGLSGEHTEYSIDPTSGKTIPTTVKDRPGAVFKSILAYGLLGGQGIGPREGEQNFAQGLLAGLGGGMRESMAGKDKLDAERRANAQQQYANQLKAQEAQRQTQELVMKQKLNDAAIANYTAQTSMEKFNLMRAYQENQHMAVQQMQAKDAPMLETFKAANMSPIKEALSPQEFQKLLADNTNDIKAHKVIPVITGYTGKNNPDGSVTWEPVGALYPPATKYTADTLSQLKDAGYKPTDPLYKSIEQKVKNNTPVEPREFLTTYKEIGEHFSLAENAAKIHEANANAARSYAEANEASIRSQMQKLQLDNLKGMENGKVLFDKIGTDLIPGKPDGSYDFSKVTDEKQRGELRDYLTGVLSSSQDRLDKLLQASKADPDNPDIKKSISDENVALSALNSRLNSLNGTRTLPGQLPVPLQFKNSKGQIIQVNTMSDLNKARTLGYQQVGPERPAGAKTGGAQPVGQFAAEGVGKGLYLLTNPWEAALYFNRPAVDTNPLSLNIPGYTSAQQDLARQQLIGVANEVQKTGEKDPDKINVLVNQKVPANPPQLRQYVLNLIKSNAPLPKGGASGDF